MKKVLYVIDTLQNGGAEQSILAIASKLTGVQTVVCTLFNKKPDLSKAYLDAGIQVHCLNIEQKLWWIKGRKKLLALINEINPAIIHAHLFKSEFLCRTIKLNKNIILIGSFVNDSYSKERYNNTSLLQRFKIYFYQQADRLTAKKVQHFTSITKSIAISNCAALNIPVSKVKIIYRGRDVSKFTQYHPKYANDQTFTFLVVARLLFRKGYKEIIYAASKLAKNKKINFSINIAGDGVDAAQIKSLANKVKLAEQLHFLGNRNDVPKLLEQSHCFLFASHYEGQGGALVEAMLSAKPIIATRMPVFEEQIEDRVTGLLFNMKDAEDLATKMLWVINNYEEAYKMGITAHKAAKDRFNIERIAKQYDEYYLNLIRNYESNSAYSKATA